MKNNQIQKLYQDKNEGENINEKNVLIVQYIMIY